MKKFILQVLIFLSIPLIIILLLDIFIRNKNTLYEEKYKGAITYKDSIEIIILGNSHANYGVNPNAFNLFAFNLATPNQSIYFDKRITNSLIPYLTKTKYVFISVDYHSLYFQSQGDRDIWSYYGNHIKYKESDYLLANISPSLFGYSLKVSVSLFLKTIKNNVKYGNDIIDFDVEDGVNLNDTISKGFISFEGSDESTFTIDSYKSRSNAFSNTIRTSDEKDEIVADLDSFIEILLAKNITPILFTSPTYSEFNKYLDQSIINENDQEIKNICQKYKIQYWNFMNSDWFLKKDYYNTDHLNKMGALKFSKMLNDSLNNLKVNGGNKGYL